VPRLAPPFCLESCMRMHSQFGILSLYWTLGRRIGTFKVAQNTLRLVLRHSDKFSLTSNYASASIALSNIDARISLHDVNVVSRLGDLNFLLLLNGKSMFFFPGTSRSSG
jgi:hypothetical protein